jgi:hypothetical protein
MSRTNVSRSKGAERRAQEPHSERRPKRHDILEVAPSNDTRATMPPLIHEDSRSEGSTFDKDRKKVVEIEWAAWFAKRADEKLYGNMAVIAEDLRASAHAATMLDTPHNEGLRRLTVMELAQMVRSLAATMKAAARELDLVENLYDMREWAAEEAYDAKCGLFSSERVAEHFAKP